MNFLAENAGMIIFCILLFIAIYLIGKYKLKNIISEKSSKFNEKLDNDVSKITGDMQKIVNDATVNTRDMSKKISQEAESEFTEIRQEIINKDINIKIN